MKRLVLFLSAGTLLASPSVAQSGPVAQQSSDQLVCQLTGDCDSSAPEATQDKGRSRGFSIAAPGQSKAKPVKPAEPVARSVGAAAPPAQRLRSTPAARTPRAGLATSRDSAVKAVSPGRADLLITFVSGSATLTEQAKANAMQFVAALPRLNGMRFAIEGHTDAVGGREYNLDLSQRRAQAVVDYLVAHGASRSSFDVRGYGFDKPLNPRNPGAAANRRVEVVKIN